MTLFPKPHSINIPISLGASSVIRISVLHDRFFNTSWVVRIKNLRLSFITMMKYKIYGLKEWKKMAKDDINITML